jgi:hypothetical protein
LMLVIKFWRSVAFFDSDTNFMLLLFVFYCDNFYKNIMCKCFLFFLFFPDRTGSCLFSFLIWYFD